MQTVVNNLGETLGAAMDATCAAKGEKSPCALTDAELGFFKRKMTSIDDGDAIGIPDGAFDGLVDKLFRENALVRQTIESSMRILSETACLTTRNRPL